MTAASSLLVVLTLLGLVGLALMFTPDRAVVPRRLRPPVRTDRVLAAAGGGTGVAVVVLALSGWALPAVISGVMAWFAIGAAMRRDGRGSAVDRIDALASWIENLRDVLVAGDQPVGAIRATAESCPPAVRPAVRRLAAALGHQDPDAAFRRFADDLDDPLGDLVAAGLSIAVQRGARTVAVLSALAEQARSQADRRRLLEAERAPLQREVRVLTVIMGGLVLALLVFGRAEYLAPYSSFEGQMVLTVALGLYAVLLVRVQRLARFPAPRRFFGSASHHDRRSAATSELVA